MSLHNIPLQKGSFHREISGWGHFPGEIFDSKEPHWEGGEFTGKYTATHRERGASTGKCTIHRETAPPGIFYSEEPLGVASGDGMSGSKTDLQIVSGPVSGINPN